MHLKLEKTFSLDVSVEAAWRLLSDIKSVAACMPGAEITGQLSATHYTCQESVRVGPISANFKGDIEVKALDENEKKLQMLGKAVDLTGATATSMDLSVWIRPCIADKCELFAVSDIHISGQMANFGSRMINPIIDQILKQFGDNLAQRVLSYEQAPTLPQAEHKSADKLNALTLLFGALVAACKSWFTNTVCKDKA